MALFFNGNPYNETNLKLLHDMQNYQASLQNGGNAMYNQDYVTATQGYRSMLDRGLIDQDEFDNMIANDPRVQAALNQTQAQQNEAALKGVTSTLEWEKTHPGFASATGDDGFLWDALDVVGAATLATGLAVAGSALIGAATGGTAGAGATGVSEGAGALAGGSGTAGTVGGGAGLAEVGTGAVAAGVGEAAIPQVIITGTAGGAGAGGLGALGTAGAIGGGLTVAEILNGTGAVTGGDYQSALPEGEPLPGTEDNLYPTDGNNNPVFSNSSQSWMDYLRQANSVRNALSGNNNNSNGFLQGLGALGDYYNNQYNKDYYKGLIDKLNGMYAYGSPEEQLLRGKIEAQDAASGRRSQYGVREMNLAGILAQQRANIMTSPAYANYVSGYTGRRDNQYNSLLGAAGSMTGGANNSALGDWGQYVNTANTLSNLWDKGSSWWNSTGSNLASSLFGG